MRLAKGKIPNFDFLKRSWDLHLMRGEFRAVLDGTDGFIGKIMGWKEGSKEEKEELLKKVKEYRKEAIKKSYTHIRLLIKKGAYSGAAALAKDIKEILPKGHDDTEIRCCVKEVIGAGLKVMRQRVEDSKKSKDEHAKATKRLLLIGQIELTQAFLEIVYDDMEEEKGLAHFECGRALVEKSKKVKRVQDLDEIIGKASLHYGVAIDCLSNLKDQSADVKEAIVLSHADMSGNYKRAWLLSEQIRLSGEEEADLKIAFKNAEAVLRLAENIRDPVVRLRCKAHAHNILAIFYHRIEEEPKKEATNLLMGVDMFFELLSKANDRIIMLIRARELGLSYKYVAAHISEIASETFGKPEEVLTKDVFDSVNGCKQESSKKIIDALKEFIKDKDRKKIDRLILDMNIAAIYLQTVYLLDARGEIIIIGGPYSSNRLIDSSLVNIHALCRNIYCNIGKLHPINDNRYPEAIRDIYLTILALDGRICGIIKSRIRDENDGLLETKFSGVEHKKIAKEEENGECGLVWNKRINREASFCGYSKMPSCSMNIVFTKMSAWKGMERFVPSKVTHIKRK